MIRLASLNNYCIKKILCKFADLDLNLALVLLSKRHYSHCVLIRRTRLDLDLDLSLGLESRSRKIWHQVHLFLILDDVSYYFNDLFLNYDNERWQFE